MPRKKLIELKIACFQYFCLACFFAVNDQQERVLPWEAGSLTESPVYVLWAPAMHCDTGPCSRTVGRMRQCVHVLPMTVLTSERLVIPRIHSYVDTYHTLGRMLCFITPETNPQQGANVLWHNAVCGACSHCWWLNNSEGTVREPPVLAPQNKWTEICSLDPNIFPSQELTTGW